jgi:hypothetical protein
MCQIATKVANNITTQAPGKIIISPQDAKFDDYYYSIIIIIGPHSPSGVRRLSANESPL